MLCISCHFRPLKPLTLRMDYAKLLDLLTSLTVSHAISPRAVCFATSRPANHAICSFIDSSGYASGPIRRCLFIDYIIISFTTFIIYCLIRSVYGKQIYAPFVKLSGIYKIHKLSSALYLVCKQRLSRYTSSFETSQMK